MGDITEEFQNSLSDVAANLSGYRDGTVVGSQLSSSATFSYSTRRSLISNDRSLLSWMYVGFGLVQTLIDQPVDDAFRHGFTIVSKQLDADDIAVLQDYMRTSGALEALIQARKWARLFGGGGVLVVTDQKPDTPLTIERINERSPMRFKAVDMHELYGPYDASSDNRYDFEEVKQYDYYGVKVDPSRVYAAKGKEAPSMVRTQLRGWGMSEIERLVRSLNQYFKNQDVVFELTDEAKVDKYGIKGLNAMLMMDGGTDKVTKRVQIANRLKSYMNALVMDSEDKFESTSTNFAGLADMLPQIRMGIAADMKMPITKLFGVSAAGFSSGEDDIENYNSMIESEIRAKVAPDVVALLRLGCQKLFGMVPDQLAITWPSLRMLSAAEQEKVKDAQFSRLMQAQSAGIVTDLEVKQAINVAALLPIHVVENNENYAPDDDLGDDETLEQDEN